MKIFILAILSILMLSCDKSPTWSDADKDNIKHYESAFRLVQEVTKLSNSKGPGVVSDQEMDFIVRNYEAALIESRLVRDDVLELARNGMSVAFRSKFQRGVELRLESWSSTNPSLEIEGSALLDEWADWSNSNRSEIKIPR